MMSLSRLEQALEHASVFVAPSQMDLSPIEDEIPLSVGIQLERMGAFPHALLDHAFGLVPVPVQTVPLVKAGCVANEKRRKSQPDWFFGSSPLHQIELLGSMSEGFYRNQLPDVLFLWGSHPEAVQTWINDMELYLKKLLNMGFLLPTSQFSLSGQNPVDSLMPATVIVGGGFISKRIHQQWAKMVQGLNLSYFDLDQQEAYLQTKILRGVWMNRHESFASALSPSASLRCGVDDIQAVGSASISTKPQLQRLKVAGGLANTQRQVQQALSKHGCLVSIETDGLYPMERLELEAFHDVCQRYFIPWVVGQDKATEAHYRRAVQQVCQVIGLRKGLFDELEGGSLLGYSSLQRQQGFELKEEQRQALIHEWHSTLVGCATWLELQELPQAEVFEALSLHIAI